ncbi:hypothetical protein HZA98_00500 [Candidatus Woesearchaeota archaeon]|nr:hypothetical protein [Candidatus Woesearchaeota archaeon]
MFNKNYFKMGLLLLVLFSLFSYSLTTALTTTIKEGGSPATPNYATLDETTIPGATSTAATSSTGASYDLSQTQSDFQITSIPQDTNVVTASGSITSFSMTNALFSLGSLIQGSFISFTNNNNIYFKSLFDASTFTAAVEKNGTVSVAQRNSMGDTGKVYVNIDTGNLTQNGNITFIPEGNNPTYVYYNTTEIQFKDGNLSLLGETITNNDQSKDATTVSFNENGFSRLELFPENSYTNGNMNIYNAGKTSLILCKQDPLCAINIDHGEIQGEGEVNFSYQNQVIYSSEDAHNIFTLNIETGEAGLKSVQEGEGLLATFYSGHFIFQEKDKKLFVTARRSSSPFVITSYHSVEGKDISIAKDQVLYANFSAGLAQEPA